MAYKTYRYRIYPNKEQQQKMMQFFGCVRTVYNMCIDYYNAEYQRWKTQGGMFKKTPFVTEYKKIKPYGRHLLYGFFVDT